MGWYHTIELAPGQETEGMFDLRPFVDRYGLPESLAGKRCLDVGTWDGFWAFEMERRGGEVVGIDLDDERLLDYPPRRRPQTFPDDPRDLGAYAHGIAHVLERVRTDHEVELVVLERPGLGVADVALHPCGGAEALLATGLASVETARRVLLHVDHPVRARERPAPAADVEHERVVGDLAKDPLAAFVEHALTLAASATVHVETAAG